MNMRACEQLVPACLVIILAAGCTSICGPKRPPTARYEKILQFDYSHIGSTNYFRTAYQNALISTNLPPAYSFETNNAQRAMLVRNDIVLELRALINQNYANYEVALRDDRNIKNTS